MAYKYNFRQRYESTLDKVKKELGKQEFYDCFGNVIRDNENLFKLYIKTRPEDLEFVMNNYNCDKVEQAQNYWNKLLSCSMSIAKYLGKCPIQNYNINWEEYLLETRKMLNDEMSVEDRKVYVKKLDAIELELSELSKIIKYANDLISNLTEEITGMLNVLNEAYFTDDREALDVKLKFMAHDFFDEFFYESMKNFYQNSNKEDFFTCALMDVLYFILNHTTIPKNERKTVKYEQKFTIVDSKGKEIKRVEKKTLEIKSAFSVDYQVKREQYPDMKSKIKKGKSRKRKFEEFLEEQIKFNDGLDAMYIYMTEKHTCIAQSWEIYQVMQGILDVHYDAENETDDKKTIESICNIAEQISKCKNLYLRYHLIHTLETVISTIYNSNMEINKALERVENALKQVVENFNGRYNQFCSTLLYFFCDKKEYLFWVENKTINEIEERNEKLWKLKNKIDFPKGETRGKEEDFRKLIYSTKRIYAQRYNTIWDSMIKGERDLFCIEENKEENQEKEKISR